MNLLIKYIFQTSLSQKKEDWGYYRALCEDVRNSRRNVETARLSLRNIIDDAAFIPGVSDKKKGCVLYHMRYDEVDGRYYNYETECRYFNRDKEYNCNMQCSFFKQKQDYLNKLNRFELLRQIKRHFWYERAKERTR